MLLIRFSAPSRWLLDGQPRDPNDTITLNNASDSFKLREKDKGLSLYRVADEAESRRIAAIFALTQRDEADKVFYLLVDEQLFTSVGPFHLNLDNPADLPRELSERHCNQSEFADEIFRAEVARQILTTLAKNQTISIAKTVAISKNELISFIKTERLHLDSNISPHINSPAWERALK